MTIHRALGLAFLLYTAVAATTAQATGMFSSTHFVEQGEFAIGLEPEFVITSGAGLGVNLRYTHGLTEWSNGGLFVGTGMGPRQLRFGTTFTLDFIPDMAGQPGIGLTAMATYYRLTSNQLTGDTFGRLDLALAPYIHKSFDYKGTIVDPFFAIPVGAIFSEGRYDALASFVVGSLFKTSEHLALVAELGVGITNSETSLSGGIVYFH